MNAPPDQPPPITHYLTMQDLRSSHAILSEVFVDDPEPVPPWESGDQSKLETCRACIEIEMFGYKKYPDLCSAVAKLFYSTIKLHIFPNANKRFALVLSFWLLAKNGHMLTAPSGVGADAAKFVAASDPRDPATTPDAVIEQMAKFYSENIGLLGDVIERLQNQTLSESNPWRWPSAEGGSESATSSDDSG